MFDLEDCSRLAVSDKSSHILVGAMEDVLGDLCIRKNYTKLCIMDAFLMTISRDTMVTFRLKCLVYPDPVEARKELK
jgi:hypothetical protein